MADTQPTQAGGGGDKPHGDGVEELHAKTGGGESGGGGYPNPQDGSKSGEGGFTGHGGQSHVNYSGPGSEEGGENANAAAGTE